MKKLMRRFLCRIYKRDIGHKIGYYFRYDREVCAAENKYIGRKSLHFREIMAAHEARYFTIARDKSVFHERHKKRTGNAFQLGFGHARSNLSLENTAVYRRFRTDYAYFAAAAERNRLFYRAVYNAEKRNGTFARKIFEHR